MKPTVQEEDSGEGQQLSGPDFPVGQPRPGDHFHSAELRRRQENPRKYRRVTRLLLPLVPVFSFGYLSCVPFFVRYNKTGRRKDRITAVGYLAGTAVTVAFIILGAIPGDSSILRDIGGFLLYILGGTASVYSWKVNGRPFAQPASVPAYVPASVWPAPAPDPNDRAVTAARATAQRRSQARAIVETEPALARDLKIGRPDLERDYDDGGLVDVDHTPAGAIAAALGWPIADAEIITSAREETGRFSSVAELAAYSSLDPYRLDAVADLMVFCRPQVQDRW